MIRVTETWGARLKNGLVTSPATSLLIGGPAGHEGLAVRFPKPTKLRTVSQIVFFFLFLLLLVRTEFRGSLTASTSEIRLPYPVSLFFQLDPLIAISNALASRALYRGLLWSLVVLIPTIFLGRFFCGWICPLGSIHHFFSSFKSERQARKTTH